MYKEYLPENNVGLTRNFMLVENKAGYLINNLTKCQSAKNYSMILIP